MVQSGFLIFFRTVVNKLQQFLIIFIFIKLFFHCLQWISSIVLWYCPIQNGRLIRGQILLNNSRTLWPIDVKFQEWWIWVRRWTLLICDDARFKMADLSEIKRSNLAILLNNSRTFWPIDVKLSGVMDIGKKMIPTDLWW